MFQRCLVREQAEIEKVGKRAIQGARLQVLGAVHRHRSRWWVNPRPRSRSGAGRRSVDSICGVGDASDSTCDAVLNEGQGTALLDGLPSAANVRPRRFAWCSRAAVVSRRALPAPACSAGRTGTGSPTSASRSAAIRCRAGRTAAARCRRRTGTQRSARAVTSTGPLAARGMRSSRRRPGTSVLRGPIRTRRAGIPRRSPQRARRHTEHRRNHGLVGRIVHRLRNRDERPAAHGQVQAGDEDEFLVGVDPVDHRDVGEAARRERGSDRLRQALCRRRRRGSPNPESR